MKFFIGTGAGDRHARAGLGVEKIGCAVAVAEFAGGAVDRGMVGRDEGELEFILAGEGGGDVGDAPGLEDEGGVGDDFLKGAAENLGVVIREVLWPAFKKLSAWLYGNGLEGLRNFGKALGVVGRLGIAMWNNALMPVFKFMAAAIGTVLEKLGMMFSALGSIKGAPD